MSDILLNLIGKLDANTVKLYVTVDAILRRMDAPYLVVGATARDLILHLGYNTRVLRATSDIDFGIKVSTWDQFDDVRASLLTSGFRDDPKVQHRLHSPEDIQIDIVPFGSVEDESSRISWPPSGDIVMNVLGFTEALEHADLVRISETPIVDIPVATPPGLALLKIVAWTDRDPGPRRKDALDLAYLCETFESIPTITDKLYDDGSVLERYEFDNTLAGAHLLGQQAADIASPETTEYIRALLDGNLRYLTVELLSEEMCTHLDSQLPRSELMLGAFRRGFLDTPG